MSHSLTVTNLTRGSCVAAQARLANRWWSRLLGLLGRRPLVRGEGLLLVPCRAVHMIGMRYAIDVAFVDRWGGVVATYHHLAPGSRSRWHRAAVVALEVPAGTLRSTETQTGDALQWRSNPEAA
ncbi:MAG TPA: DUF192 domain-containing protein [Gemmatimonadales bacterium]|nr:DUF192 domain-containing protein [Gemmatimonadales bacterium]